MNSNNVKIGLIQQAAADDRETNLSDTLDAIADAADKGAQIICTQELFQTPYFCRKQDTACFDLAESIPGPATDKLCALARQKDVVIIASLFEARSNDIYHNTATVIDADGSLLGIYRKMHIPQDPGFEEKFYFTPGDTGYKSWKTKYANIGVLICWDQWFPEAARLTAMQGADILFYPTAIGWLEDEKESLGDAQHGAWETIQRSHAIANGCYVASVNRCGKEGDIEFWGQSFVADCYGDILSRAPVADKRTLIEELDLNKLREFRRIWPFGRDRRVDSYSQIGERALD